VNQPEEALEPRCRIDEAGPTSTLHLSGAWQLGRSLPSAESAAQGLQAAAEVRFDVSELRHWDTGLMVFLLQLERLCRERGLEVDPSGLPDGARRLYRLATAVAPASRAEPKAPAGLFWRVGQATLAAAAEARAMITFIGEATLAFGRLVTGRARFHRSDLVLTIQEVGAKALPIVSLISFLVGVILAFLGSVQLLQFGAQIYVAPLVAIGMARDMAAMMVGIILAGRTGAAFAAQLGTMQVNEEIDALTTFGFVPMEFLVLPRMLALILMTPLLCLYADLMGILGGAFVGVMFLDLPPFTYFQATQEGVRLIDFGGGLFKAAVYGALVAAAGCLRGIQCGRSSAAVGQATTSAVVTSIVLIVVSMAILTVIYNVLGI
jgi:phospholipid/cholesterol/gamma-HCH transport system permease protein